MREQQTPDLFVARTESPDQLLPFFGVVGRIRGRINDEDEAAGLARNDMEALAGTINRKLLTKPVFAADRAFLAGSTRRHYAEISLRGSGARRFYHRDLTAYNPVESGGRGGIRTHGTLAGTPVFKTGALNHSATLPSSRHQPFGAPKRKNGDIRSGGIRSSDAIEPFVFADDQIVHAPQSITVPGQIGVQFGFRYEVHAETSIGPREIAGYQFGHDWEIVPGTWTIELWDGDRKLASQSFQVVKG